MNAFAPKRIVVATDFSDNATTALNYAKSIARTFGSSIILVHADPYVVPLGGVPFEGLALADSVARQETVISEALEEYRRKHLAEFANAETVLISGSPATAVLSVAKSRDANLIVMGTHGRSGFQRLMLGSVAERVLHLADRPVLTVRGVEPPPPIRRILCPVNYSAVAGQSFEYAVALSEAFQADLIVLRMVEGVADLDAEVERLRVWVGPATQSTRPKLLILHGDPAGQVLQYAREKGADLIVVGAHHKRFGDRTTIGSTTQQITREAECPVLCVPGASD